MKYHTFGHRDRVVTGGDRGGRNRRHGLTALVGALATAATLAAAGCATSTPTTHTSAGGSTPAGTGGVVTPTPQPSSKSSTAAGKPMSYDARSGISGGALFGGDMPLTPLTSRLGRKLAIVRVYYQIGEKFHNPQVFSLMASGTTVLVSLSETPGHGVSYASIAAGKQDGSIKSFLQEVEQAAVTYHLGAIYFTFQVEANNPEHKGLGTPAQFVQAWDHVHQLAVQMHLDWNQGGRMHWVFILTELAYTPMATRPKWADSAGAAPSFWPGANEVDIVAADGYNTGGCRGATVQNYVASGTQVVTPEQLFDPMLDFAKTHGNLPVFIPEWASVAYASSNEQPRFIDQMGSFVAANHQIAAALYWNSQAPGRSCDYKLNNQPTSLTQLTSVAHSVAFQGHVMPPPS